MKTGNLNYIRLFFRYNSCNNDRSAIYYSLKYKSDSNFEVFTNEIKLEKSKKLRKFSSIDYNLLLYLRDKSNWKYCKNSGLALTFFENVFYGNIPQDIKFNLGSNTETISLNPKYFFIAQRSPCNKNLIIDVFEDFYPNKDGLIDIILRHHNFIYDTNLKGLNAA